MVTMVKARIAAGRRTQKQHVTQAEVHPATRQPLQINGKRNFQQVTQHVAGWQPNVGNMKFGKKFGRMATLLTWARQKRDHTHHVLVLVLFRVGSTTKKQCFRNIMGAWSSKFGRLRAEQWGDHRKDGWRWDRDSPQFLAHGRNHSSRRCGHDAAWTTSHQKKKTCQGWPSQCQQKCTVTIL